MAKFTVYDAFQLTWKVRWKDQASARDQHTNGMIGVNFFGKTKPLAKIKSPDLIEFQQSLRFTEGRSGYLKAGTINKRMMAFGTMLSTSVRAGYLEVMPTMPQLLPTRSEKDRVITQAEEELFIKFFQKACHHEEADLFVVMLDTLARWSDIERCHCMNFNPARQEVTYTYRKNKLISTLPLTARANAALLRLTANRKPTDPIYDGSYWSFKAVFDDAKAWMGLADDKWLTPHCTRHTGASRLAAAGESLPKIQGMGGWLSLSSVRRYMHFDTSALLSCRDVLQG